MRLKSLKLSGFKSFANTTTFTFKHGITAIVGPNGCGKSNVIDAIRWVLGESSAKQLRGGAMSDIIFAGTQDKAAKSYASVELTFEHTQDEHTGIRHELNLYHELSVRRQVNKDGKSDYFINGTRCRRRDVVDIFLGTGLGSRSYSVIQQGMIGRIVDSSPLQLREFIEEAAGVSRYQARRAETQKKLTQVSENLTRLNDIKSELTRRQNTLAKQAKSAAVYQQLQHELDEVKYQLATAHLYHAKDEQIQATKVYDEYAGHLKSLSESRNQLGQKTDKLNERIAQASWLKDKAQEQLHQQAMAQQTLAHQAEGLQTELNQTDAQLQHNIQAQTQAKQDKALLLHEIDSTSNALDKLYNQYEVLTQQRQQQEIAPPFEQAWQEVNQRLATLQETKRTLEGQQALQAQSIQQLERQQAKWSQNQQLLQTKIDALQQDDTPKISEFADLIDKLSHQVTSLTRQQEDVTVRLETTEPQLTQIKHMLTDKTTQLTALQQRHATIIGEYDTLHSIVHSKQQTINNTAKTTTPADSDTQNTIEELTKLPTLHDSITLSEQGKDYASVLDKWLGFWLDSRILTDSQILNNSHSNGIGADILTALLNHSPHDDYDKSNTNTHEQPQAIDSLLFTHDIGMASDNAHRSRTAKHLSLSQSIIPLSHLIATPNLSLWQSLYLYDQAHSDTNNHEMTTVELKAIMAQLPAGSLLLTSSGWCITPSMAIHSLKITGQNQNSAESAQFLTQRIAQQQRLETLNDVLNDIEADIDTREDEIKQLNREFEQLNIDFEELKAQSNQIVHNKHNAQQQLTELKAKQQEKQTKLEYLQDTQQQLQLEKQEIQTQRKTLSTLQVDINHQLSEVAPKLTATQEELQRLKVQRQAIEVQQRQNDEQKQQLQVDINKAEHTLEFANKQLTTLDNTYQKLQQKQSLLEKQSAKQSEQLPKIKSKLVEAEVLCHEYQIALDEHRDSINQLNLEYAQYQQQRDALSLQLEQTQQQHSDAGSRLAVANERIKEASERLDTLNSTYAMQQTNSQTHRPSASALLTDFIINGSAHIKNSLNNLNNMEALQHTEQTLTQKLSKIGAVNLAAVDELAEVETRLIPLTEQIDDIELSITTLTDAIATIDNKTKSLFLDTLNAVNKDLSALFTKVFGGGQAALTLIDDDTLAKGEKWRAGLELMAQPKGKRNSRLAVLSGGEKTLTALSLIFAIFKQHPAPFCVLDEVDAPLDDANVSRFTGLIHELASDVQFIFISHNKLAMQIADELMGVTMPQSGISSLVSVSLAEAEQYLES